MIEWKQRHPRNTFMMRAIGLLLGVALLSLFEGLERINYVIYDKISAQQQPASNDNIVIVAIDEESLQTLGRWPWSRRVHAELINRLSDLGNPVVALDLLFSEPQDNDPFADNMLAAAFARHGAVILPVVPTLHTDAEFLYQVEPLSMFRDHALLGHADIELDSDGIARRIFLKAGIDTPQWPAMALVMSEQIRNGLLHSDKSLPVKGIKAGGRWVRSQEVLIPYAGPPGSFHHVSYAQVLFDEKVRLSLQGKAIIVGMTATGIGTRFATPVSPINRQPMSGVEWHANVFSMLQQNRAIYPASPLLASLVSVGWVFILLFLIGILQRNLTIPLLLILLGCGLLFTGALLRYFHIWIPPGAALLGTIAIYPLWNWRRINEFMRSLFIAKIRSNVALASVGDGVITTDAQDHVIYMNKGAEKILGVSLNKIQGTSLKAVLNLSKTHDSAYHELKGPELPIPAFSVSTIQCYLKTMRGEKRAVRITRHMLRDEREELMGFVVAIADITDTIELTRQIAYQASYDTLTNLPNRALLLTRFEELISVIQQSGKIITVFFVTLDNFKKINDALGHRAGDELLKMVSQRIQETVRHVNIVARWGGDEFVLLFDDLHKEDMVPQMAHTVLHAMRQQFELDGQAVFVTVSIGISFYPQDGEHGEAVLERAGTAMYRIKHEGGNSFGFYSPESSVVWTRDQLEFEKDLRLALNDGHLQVLYQPIVDVSRHRIVRMEALVRWPHPTRGYLSPADFIPLAEHIGVIEQLGEVVLRSACIAAQKLLQAGTPIAVSVNVNPRQLMYGDFAQSTLQILTATGLPASLLILEITESAIVNNITHVSAVLNRIKALGVLIALDDFGTGYSSLTLLRELPIDILKIDKSFIRTLDKNSNDLTITQAMIGLGNNLGMAIIAEGVESEQQAQILLDHHCHLQQGYYFSRPVSYESFVQLLKESNEVNPASISRLCNAVSLH